MAPSALPFEPSYTALKSLRQKVSNYTTTSITLPHRPENLSTDLHPYLDNAIVTLSTSTAYLYDNNAPWAIRVVEVKEGVERVDTKVEEVKTEVAEIKTEVAEIKTEVAEIKTEVAEIKTEVNDVKLQVMSLERQMDDVRNSLFNQTQSLNNHTFIQLNSMRKWLDDSIEPISAPVQDGGCQRYIVAKGFPNRIKDFWRLVSDPTTLTELARHYSVRDWERWKRASSRDTDVSCYTELEDAVTAQPLMCLRALAMRWGLQYSLLEYPGQQEGLGRRQKRKAETDSGSRRVKAREDQGNDSATGSESTSSQDLDGQQSQPSGVIQVQVPPGTERRYGSLIERIIAATERDDRRHSPKSTHWEPSDSPELQWRVGSTPSTERRRNRIRHDGRSITTSESHKLRRRRGSRDSTPREELRRPVSSPEPTRPFSSEELRRLAPGLDPT